MNKRDFAQVLVKVLGLYYFIPSLIQFLGQLPEYSRISSKLLAGEWDANPLLSYMIQTLLLAFFGLFLILKSDWVVKHVLRLKETEV